MTDLIITALLLLWVAAAWAVAYAAGRRAGKRFARWLEQR